MLGSAINFEFFPQSEYSEINLTNRSMRWNPFDTPYVGKEKKAELLAVIQDNFYGRGIEPFWHQIYAEALRWTMEALEYTGRRVYGPADIHELFGDRETLQALMNRVSARAEETGDADEGKRGRTILAWYEKSWLATDAPHRSSACVGIKILLEIFGKEPVKRTFSGMTPEPGSRQAAQGTLSDIPGAIAAGRVIGLNIPHNEDGRLGRTAGLLLKQAWLAGVRKYRKPDRNHDLQPIYLICDDLIGNGMDTDTDLEPDPF